MKIITQPQITSVGSVKSINQGCAVIKYMHDAFIGEEVYCVRVKSKGIVTGITASHIIVLFFSNYNKIKENDIVLNRGKLLETSFSYNDLGKIINV